MQTSREILDGIANGTTAVKRQNPKFGETPYFYLNPNSDPNSHITDKDIANVNSPNDPNPFLQKENSNGIISLANREWDIVSQMPDRLKSFGQTAYNLITDYNGYMNSPQEYKTQDPVSLQNSTLENTANYWKQYNTMKNEKISDINKHQYMSCLAGRDGVTLGLVGLGAGVVKEIGDLSAKLTDEQKIQAYGGKTGVWADSLKDMGNNLKGFSHGFFDNQPCYPLLKKPLP